jgi:hypothetical protein
LRAQTTRALPKSALRGRKSLQSNERDMNSLPENKGLALILHMKKVSINEEAVDRIRINRKYK